MVAHQLSSMILAESDFHVKKNNNNEQPLSCTHIIKRLETKLILSKLYTSDIKIKNVYIIHKWLKD
jgi:hypothetical protein